MAMFDGFKVYALCVVGALAVLINHFAATVPGTSGDSSDWLAQLWGIAMVAAWRSALGKIRA